MPTIFDIVTMPGETAGGKACYVAYSDTAQVCVVAANRQEAIALAVARCTEKLNATAAAVIDFAAKGPTMEPSRD